MYFCKTCKTEKPIELMVKSKKTRSGIQGLCKECRNAYQRKQRGMLGKEDKSIFSKLIKERQWTISYSVPYLTVVKTFPRFVRERVEVKEERDILEAIRKICLD